MNLSQLETIITQQSDTVDREFKRLFHGRGGLYDGWKHLTIDSIDTILSVALYFNEKNEAQLIEMLENFVNNSKYTTLVVQRRYLKGAPSEVIIGELPEENFVIENGIKIKLNLNNNQNNGYRYRYTHSYNCFL